MTLSQDKFDALEDQVRRMLAAQGLSFEELSNCALDIVVFGSRAAGVHRSDSDLDLLVISDKSGHKRRGKLDLVFVPKTVAASPLWRRTEIARHIAQFGVSLMHERPLIDPIIDGYAAQRKQARLHTLVKSLLPCWQTLSAELKRKYFTRLRRELQRYQFLREGHPVPRLPFWIPL